MVAFLLLALKVSHPDPYKLESAVTGDGGRGCFLPAISSEEASSGQRRW